VIKTDGEDLLFRTCCLRSWQLCCWVKQV